AAIVEQAHGGDLDFAAAPAAFAIGSEIARARRSGRWLVGGGVAVLAGEQRVLAAGDVGEIRVDDALGIALIGRAAATHPEGLVAHLLHQAEAVGDEEDNLTTPTKLTNLIQTLTH